jgi:uncharacterized protein (DUF924 family)
MVTPEWIDEVLAFGFGLAPEQWFNADPELDDSVRERFLELWETQRGNLPETFLGSPREALAAVVLFDQFPRNMFRGHADQFATDHLALQIAKAAVDRGHDDQLEPIQRGILYMPFQHSEDLDDQQRSIGLFTALGDAKQLGFARKHHDVIARFGRFPHRNEVLGRTPRPDEVAAGDVFPW